MPHVRLSQQCQYGCISSFASANCTSFTSSHELDARAADGAAWIEISRANAHLHARGVQVERIAQRCGARGEHRQQRVCIAAREPLQPLQRGLQPAQGQRILSLKTRRRQTLCGE